MTKKYMILASIVFVALVLCGIYFYAKQPRVSLVVTQRLAANEEVFQGSDDAGNYIVREQGETTCGLEWKGSYTLSGTVLTVIGRGIGEQMNCPEAPAQFTFTFKNLPKGVTYEIKKDISYVYTRR